MALHDDAPLAPAFVRPSRDEGEDNKPPAEPKNMIKRYTSAMSRSHLALADGKLGLDVQVLMDNAAFYYQSLLCKQNEFDIMTGLVNDLKANHESSGEDGSFVNWSQHLKFENPQFSPTFRNVIDRLSEFFSLEVLACRLNFYRDGKDWKPFHRDSHAYGKNGAKEDFTCGASFGDQRDLAFRHEETNLEFTFPQKNGDVFAFNSEANKRFQHGVPKISRKCGPRFSIIAWGRRVRLTPRNASREELALASSRHGQSTGLLRASEPSHETRHGYAALPHVPAADVAVDQDLTGLIGGSDAHCTSGTRHSFQPRQQQVGAESMSGTVDNGKKGASEGVKVGSDRRDPLNVDDVVESVAKMVLEQKAMDSSRSTSAGATRKNKKKGTGAKKRRSRVQGRGW